MIAKVWFPAFSKGVVSCLHALRAGRRHPKGRHRDLENRALAAFPAGTKTHQSDIDAEEGRVERTDLQDVAANEVTSEHVPLEPSQKWKQWGTVCQAVRKFWHMVGPKWRERLEQWPRVRLPAPESEPEI
eukprot:955052-Amphidinium_carterae.1